MIKISTITALGFDITSSWSGRGVTGATKDLEGLKAAIESINGKDVSVEVDDSKAKATIDDLKAELDAFASMHSTATADVDAQKEMLDDLKAELDAFAGEHKTATADVDAQRAALDSLKADLDQFGAKHVSATADVNAQTAALDGLKVKLDEFGMMHKTATADVDTNSASSGMRSLSTIAQDLVQKLQGLGSAGGGAAGGLNSTGAAAASSGGNMNFFVAAMAVAAVLLASLLPTLGGFVTGMMGVGAAVGVVMLALKPVISALQDFGAAQQQAGAQSAQMASQQHSNAVAIANAQQAITQAQQSAAQTQITSAAAVEAAQNSLRNSVISLESAQRQQVMNAQQSANSLISAEQGVTNAQIADTQATQALTQARIDAKNAMDNLKNSVADAGLSVRSAQLQLQQAQLNQANLGPGATDLQRQQAQLAVDQAKQAIIDQQTRLQQLQQQQKASTAAGVEGSAQVVSAKNAERLAAQNVLNTERALQMARLTAANSAVNAADAVKRAQNDVANSEQQLSRAQAQAAFSNQQAQQRVVQSQRALNDLIIQQRLQEQATAAASPWGKYQQDLQNLSGPGRDLVNMLTQSKGLLTQLSQNAQNAFLPGFNRFVADALRNLPTLNGAIQTFGQGFGDFTGKLGDWASTPMAQGQFNTIIHNAAGFMQDLGDATLKLAPSFTKFLSDSGPAAQAWGQGLGQIIGTGLPSMFKTLTQYIQPASQFLSQFLGAISDLLPIIGKIGGILSELFAPVMGPLRQLIDAVANALLPAFDQLAPAIGQVAGDLLQSLVPVVNALAPLIQLFAIGLAAIIRWLEPLVPILAPLAAGLWLVNFALEANPALAIASALVILVGGIVYLATKTQFFQTIWRDTWNGVKAAWDTVSSALKIAWDVFWAWLKNTVDVIWAEMKADWNGSLKWLNQQFNAFIAPFKSLWNESWGEIKTIATGIWDVILGAWDIFNGKFSAGVQKLVDGVKGIWNGIVNVFKTPINAVIDIWNTVGGFLGLPHITPIGDSSNQPFVGQGVGGVTAGHGALLATGGYVSGPGSGTSDSIPAWLSNGEYVMPAHVVQHYGVGTMEQMRSKRLASGGLVTHDGAPGYLFGGLVDIGKSLLHDAGSALSSGLGALKNIAASAVYDVAKPLLDKVISIIPHPIPGIGEPFGDVIYDIGKKVEGGVLGMLKGVQDKAAASAGGTIGKAVGAIATGAHKQIIDAALKAAGVPSSLWGKWESGMNTLITRESSWNPNAQNNVDINAKNGDPSRGLAQVIGTTFRAYHAPGTSMNIFDPVANVAAAIRYILSRYKDISNVQQANPNLPPKGYALGTNSATRGWSIVGERGPEAIDFSGGETVKSFSETMGAIGAGTTGMKAVADAIANMDSGDVYLSMPITIEGGDADTAQELADKLEADLVPKLTMLLKQKVGSR